MFFFDRFRISRIFQALPAEQVRHTEVLVIDDNSQDSTSNEIEILREKGYNVHLHVRKNEKGLSSAVLFGFNLSQGKKLLVMDADLQHPPESVPSFLDALDDPPLPLSISFGEKKPATQTIPEEKKPKFALGTRYAKGYEMDKDWPVYRRLISWGARLLSRPLTNAQDPMGGFFALRKDLVGYHITHESLAFYHMLTLSITLYNNQFLASQPLNPSGFKIGLELLLKTPLPSSQLVHVPYGFSKRITGTSKLGMKVIIKYMGQLLALYQWKFGLVFYLFIFVVVSLGLNLVILLLDWFVRRLGWEESKLGRYMLINKRQKRRHKSDV